MGLEVPPWCDDDVVCVRSRVVARLPCGRVAVAVTAKQDIGSANGASLTLAVWVPAHVFRRHELSSGVPREGLRVTRSVPVHDTTHTTRGFVGDRKWRTSP